MAGLARMPMMIMMWPEYPSMSSKFAAGSQARPSWLNWPDRTKVQSAKANGHVYDPYTKERIALPVSK